MAPDPRPLVVDTDTAVDDTQALLLACLSERLDVRAVTVVAGNVAFEREVENAKYTLELAGRTEIPVYEGARQPLVKDHEYSTEIHGEGGLGGELFPETGNASAEGFAPSRIVELAREHSGDLAVLCIGPLTNLAVALAEEPALGDLLGVVWVMGGAVDCPGNVTPTAEFNFWADPDAARRVLDAVEVHLVDWGLTTRAGVIGPDTLDTIGAMDTELADFFETINGPVCEHSREEQGLAGPTMPDALAAACMAYPELHESVGTYRVAVDERAGLTRGYSSAEPYAERAGDSPDSPPTHVVEAADADQFRAAVLAMLGDRSPDDAFDGE